MWVSRTDHGDSFFKSTRSSSSIVIVKLKRRTKKFFPLSVILLFLVLEITLLRWVTLKEIGQKSILLPKFKYVALIFVQRKSYIAFAFASLKIKMQGPVVVWGSRWWKWSSTWGRDGWRNPGWNDTGIWYANWASREETHWAGGWEEQARNKFRISST